MYLCIPEPGVGTTVGVVSIYRVCASVSMGNVLELVGIILELLSSELDLMVSLFSAIRRYLFKTGVNMLLTKLRIRFQDFP